MAQQPPIAAGKDGIDQLVQRIEGVERELSTIRQILDAIREDLAWWLNNNRRDEWSPVQPITSMPADPLATDWPQRLNRQSPSDLPKNSEPPSTHDQPSEFPLGKPADKQQGLFGDD